MPLLLILAMGVFVWMLWTYRARQRTKHCRWRADRSRDTAAGHYFVCVSCGAETFCADNTPPAVCLNPGRPGR